MIPPDLPRSPYQASVSYNCFRFNDSVMHFKPEVCTSAPSVPTVLSAPLHLCTLYPCGLQELNVLLRSIPAKPVTRRLFFTMVVACRRRLRKAWEQTALVRSSSLRRSDPPRPAEQPPGLRMLTRVAPRAVLAYRPSCSLWRTSGACSSFAPRRDLASSRLISPRPRTISPERAGAT